MGDWFKLIMNNDYRNMDKLIEFVSKISSILYGIWYARNQKKFQAEEINPISLITLISKCNMEAK